jgi:hypothetical protein
VNHAYFSWLMALVAPYRAAILDTTTRMEMSVSSARTGRRIGVGAVDVCVGVRVDLLLPLRGRGLGATLCGKEL